MYNGQELPQTPQVETGQERIPEPELKQEYRPSNREALREFEIRIRFLSRGCIVSVGCK